MSDPMPPKLATDASVSSATEFARLHRIVQGLIDADLLLAEEGCGLLKVIDAAHWARDRGAAEDSRWHTRRFVRTMEALVRDGRLDAAHAGAALAAARGMLETSVG